jgi:hypothetical protein
MALKAIRRLLRYARIVLFGSLKAALHIRLSLPAETQGNTTCGVKLPMHTPVSGTTIPAQAVFIFGCYRFCWYCLNFNSHLACPPGYASEIEQFRTRSMSLKTSWALTMIKFRSKRSSATTMSKRSPLSWLITHAPLAPRTSKWMSALNSTV